jgi:hypothetical protein
VTLEQIGATVSHLLRDRRDGGDAPTGRRAREPRLARGPVSRALRNRSAAGSICGAPCLQGSARVQRPPAREGFFDMLDTSRDVGALDNWPGTSGAEPLQGRKGVPGVG